MSTRCITCPPSSFPSGFVCAGRTISVISDRDALTGFPCNCASRESLPTFFRFIRTLVSRSILTPSLPPPYNTGRPNDRTKENPPPDARRIRRYETGRRLLPLRPRPGVHERRRPLCRRLAFSRSPRTQRRLHPRLSHVDR